MTQGADKGQCAPVAIWSKAPQPLAFQAPASQRRHIGLDPGFIDEYQPARVEERLPGLPALTPPHDVGARLFKSKQRSPPSRGQAFLNRNPSRRRNTHTALCETVTPRAASSSFSPCSVRCGVCLIRSAMKPRCGSSTRKRWYHLTTEDTATPNRAAAARQLSPASTAATTRSRRSLERGRTIRCWPPIPASILNHDLRLTGIPSDSITQ